MSYFFNADYESFLKQNKKKYTVNSNRLNQEFEYFILWLELDALYTKKKYDDSYLEFLENFTSFSITDSQNDLNLWCAEIEDINLSHKLNSKLQSTEFAIKNNLCHQSTKIISSKESYEKGFLYKEEFGVSGSGNFLYSPDRNLEFPLIKEKLLDRFFDFSAMIDNDDIEIYQNHIDNYFQYRGTTIGLRFSFFDWYEDYLKSIQLIKEQFYRGKTLSIDSFLYKEFHEEKVYILSEINNRKTMGYIASKLKENYFSEYQYGRLRLYPTKKLRFHFKHREIYEKFSKKIIPLSPLDNRFVTFFLCEDSLGELNELEDLLVSTLFEDF